MKSLKVFLICFFIFFIIAGIYLSSAAFLISIFHSESIEVRRWAVDALIAKGQGVTDMVLQIAEDEKENPEIRREAVFILGEIHNEDTVDNLIRLMNSAPPLVQGQAAYALRKMKHPKAIEALIEGYNSGSKEVMSRALMAMGEMNDPRTMEILKKASSNEDKYIRDVANAGLRLRNIR